MSRYFAFARSHPYLLAALMVVFFLPWAWMAILVPPWAALTSFALVPVSALIALALVVKDIAGEDDGLGAFEGGGRDGRADDSFLKWRKRTRLFQQVVVGLDTMLERWDQAAAQNRERLAEVSRSVEEVIRLTETAVGDISKSFRVLIAKAHQQTQTATALLRSDGNGGVLSMPEFIKAYDSQLVNVTQHMTRFSEAADELAQHQKRVTEHARVMEETIDGLRDMASQISRIALDGSVAMTSAAVNARDFVEMTDRIRAISAQAHELTRRTRQNLDAIGDEVRQGNRRAIQVAEAARRAVEVARAEIDTLNAATIEQTRQIEAALTHVNALSVEIQRDINQIIVAMQFQDITRQKLEKLQKPTIGAAADSLSMLSHETRALLQRDLYRAVRAYSQSAVRLPDGRAAEGQAQQPVGEKAEPASDGKKVELF